MYNILIFPGWFPSKENPLNAIFTKKHVDLISVSNNVKVVYVEKSINQESTYKLLLDYKNGYPICICYYKASSSFFSIYKKAINFYRRINAYHKAIKCLNKNIKEIDFIHIHVISYETIIPLFYNLFKKIPYFVSEHSTTYLRETSVYSFNNIFKRVIIIKSLGISVVSEALKNGIEKLNIKHDNFFIIPNYVDEHLFHYQPKKRNKVIKFLHVSRLNESAKNVTGILNAFNWVYRGNQQIELHIIGGTLNVVSEAELYAGNLEARSNIFFHGLKFGSDIIPYYHESDILLMFSNYETQGVVAMEALFCGLPVLATNLSCLNEYLHNKNSLVVNPFDLEGLINNMQLFIDGKCDFWTPEKIVEDVSNKFSSKTIGSSFNTLYQKGLIG